MSEKEPPTKELVEKIPEPFPIIVFVSQNTFDLSPLDKNRPPALFDVGGQLIIERLNSIAVNFPINQIILLVTKEHKEQIVQMINKRRPFKTNKNGQKIYTDNIIFTHFIYDPKKGLTNDFIKVLTADNAASHSIWIDGNVIFSYEFFINFLDEWNGNDQLLLGNIANKQQSKGIGIFSNEFIQKHATGITCVCDLIEQKISQEKYPLKIMTFQSKEMEFWQINHIWELLDANQILIQKNRFTNKGNVEKGAVLKGEISIGEGTRIRSGSYIEGPVIIGRNCDIGPNCYLRKGVSLGDNVRIGNACEIKNSIIYDNTHIAHLSYVGDSIIGSGCNFGAGTITGNLRLDDKPIKTKTIDGLKITGRRKIGVLMGDNVKTAINVFFMPGVIVGNNSAIGSGVILSRNLEENTFVRQEQSLKKKPWSPDQN
ncbi:MAG: DapH/DapD/GlmU-related protein [Asgard group archaeon]|nr:DapH/DapD/GlmU-related protein [Asgard group archaeon]